MLLKLLVCSTTLALTLPLTAQSAPQAGALPRMITAQRAPAVGPPADLAVSSRFPGITVLNTPNAPFTARQVGDWTMMMQDGTKDERTYFSIIARDSEGRVYRELRRLVPGSSSTGSELMEFFIQDPVSGFRYECLLANHRCTAFRYRAQLHTAVPKPGSFDQGRRFLSIENLGSSTVNDLSVTGSRETTTFQPGTIGNDKVTSFTREMWFSPELNINLSVKRIDPRTGTQTVHFEELSRVEPPASQFKVPAEYSIMDGVDPAVPGQRPARTAPQQPQPYQ